LFKDVLRLVKNLDNAELLEKLLEVKELHSDLRDENLQLNEKNRELQGQLELQARIEFDKGVYWIRNDPQTPGKVDTPICPKCYDSDSVVVRQAERQLQLGRGFECANCEGVYFVK
jgi:hypothetical protein